MIGTGGSNRVKRSGTLRVVGVLLAVVTLAACNSDQLGHRVLTTLFEGVPKPGEETPVKPLKREPRHPSPPKHEERKVPIVETALPQPDDSGPIRTWDQAMGRLPKDAAGGIDWVQALEKKAIEPKPGLDDTAKDQDVLPLEVELEPKGQPVFKATFPHQAHTEWLACENCHTDIFQMQAGAAPITMAKIFAGEYCGRCHGTVAFAPATGCPRCHPALAPAAPVKPPREPLALDKLKTWEDVTKALPASDDGVDWMKALTDGLIAPRAAIDPKAPAPPPVDIKVELVPEGQEEMKVVFPHLAHTGWLTCTNCHPGIFQMKKGADPITMEKIQAGEYCGRCHGTVAFAPTTCPRCHASMAGG